MLNQIMRYSRQEIFPGIGPGGQKRLGGKTAVIVGLGALGSVSSQLLARAGIGNLILIDRDIVELSNLQRQGLFGERDIGKPKASSAERHIRKINSEIRVKSYFDHLDYTNLDLLRGDIILDGTDNMETRFLINEYSLREKIPWVYGAVLGASGYVFPVVPGGPCFRCIFREVSGLGTCDTEGVLNTATGIIGSLQANEALKALLGREPERRLVFLNAWKNEMDRIGVRKSGRCPACRGEWEYLSGERRKDVVRFCGSGSYLFRGDFDFRALKARLKKAGRIQDWGGSFHFRGITVFGGGRVLVKAGSEKAARSLYSRYIGN